MLKNTAALLLILLLAGCASQEKLDTNTAEGAFAMAQKLEKDERYDEAVSRYSEVKNKFPYHSLSNEAELRIADIEFKRENFVEAESAYKLFKEFHPDHPKIDYVTFQLGLSIFNQLPETTDRDLSLAQNAIDTFDQVLNSYPKSTHVTSAKEYRGKAQNMLADKENYVANYYFIREKWQSALGRYEDLLRNYPKSEFALDALYKATLSAYRLKDMDKAKTYFKRLLNEYPNSEQLASARKELADGF